MKKYYFVDYYYDSKTGREEEYNIESDRYNELLQFCFKHSKYFSFTFFPDRINLPEWLLNIQLPKNHICLEWWSKHRTAYVSKGVTTYNDIFLLELTPETKKWIEGVTDNIFSWMNRWEYKNPEDPVFYREDGSIMFFSVIHEGICELRLKEDEESDARQIINSPLWRTYCPKSC